MGYPVPRSAPRGASGASGLSSGRAASSAAAAMNARTPLAPMAPMVGKGLARFIPFLGWALLAYDLYELYQVGKKHWGFSPLSCGATSIPCALPAPPAPDTHATKLLGYNPGNQVCCAGAPAFITPPGPTVTAYSAIRYGTSGTPPVTRYRYSEKFGRDVGYTGLPLPHPRFRRARELVTPQEMPWLDPWDLPINNPVPDFRPLPYRYAPYRTDPFPNPDPSPVPSPRPAPKPRPRPEPVPRPGTNPEPKLPRPADPVGPSPVPQPVPEPGPGPEPTYRPDPYSPTRPKERTSERERFRNKRKPPKKREKPKEKLVRSGMAKPRPPGKNTREVKLRSRAAAIVWTVANNITEARDFIDGLWKPLPKEFKSETVGFSVGKHGGKKAPTVQQKLADLYKAIPHLMGTDARSQKYWNDALDELITNQIKDYVFGKAGSALSGVNQSSGRPVGYGAGPAL